MEDVGFSIVNRSNRAQTLRVYQESEDWSTADDFEDDVELIKKHNDTVSYTKGQLALTCLSFFICGVSFERLFLPID